MGGAAVLIGIDIVLAVTTPVHTVYWMLSPNPTAFAVIEPRIGYWLHTLLLVGLLGGGTVLFSAAWRGGVNTPYTRAYSVIGSLLVVAIIADNELAPGGFSVAPPPLAVGLTTVGWFQANRGGILALLRSLAPE